MDSQPIEPQPIEPQPIEPPFYEFNTTQERLIRELTVKMRFVGYILIAVGILLILGGIVRIGQGGIGGIINGIIQLLIGIWTSQAAASFKQIVKTQGNDIENLMDALKELKKLYTLQYWLFIIALVFIFVGLIAAIFMR